MPIKEGLMFLRLHCQNGNEGNLLIHTKQLLCRGISSTADRVPVDETAAPVPAEVIPSDMLELVGGVGWMVLATFGTGAAVSPR
jgi:hypothetical protein